MARQVLFPVKDRRIPVCELSSTVFAFVNLPHPMARQVLLQVARSCEALFTKLTLPRLVLVVHSVDVHSHVVAAHEHLVALGAGNTWSARILLLGRRIFIECCCCWNYWRNSRLAGRLLLWHKRLHHHLLLLLLHGKVVFVAVLPLRQLRHRDSLTWNLMVEKGLAVDDGNPVSLGCKLLDLCLLHVDCSDAFWQEVDGGSR